MLIGFDVRLPENLSDVEVVTSSEYSRKLSTEKVESNSKEDRLKVVMPSKEQDMGLFTSQYTCK